MTQPDPKRDQRRSAAARRRMACLTFGAAAAGLAIRDVLSHLSDLAAARVVAGFWPMAGEVDLRPTLHWLAAGGRGVALPVMGQRGAPLVFRQWTTGAMLEERRYGVREPSRDAPAVDPDVVLVPLLAFDRRGVRLGYGGGYYDRTLAALRRARPRSAIGVAFAVQEESMLAAEAHDQLLDLVVTERGIVRPDPSVRASTFMPAGEAE